jgi:hypothetical protein|tara:strand:- start:1427 stop:2011 length:585 start_codon:yes stop_codon:yes gene_type:complete
MTENKIIHQCSNCTKTYKSNKSLKKHEDKCCVEEEKVTENEQTSSTETSSKETSSKENNYDVNMTFLDDNQVKVEVKKQFGEDDEDGDEVLKEILKPKISNSYQEEIDKLDDMVKMIKTFPISDDPAKKDQVIDQLKNTLAILMTQSQNLIKEMQQMSRRNSYFKNNIILAAFILDKCRKDVPETEEEFDNMFN